MPFFLFRILAGAVLIVSGFQKLIQPYQNFQVVIESYEVVSGTAARVMAIGLPWVEFLCGIFLLLGLGAVLASRVAWCLYAIFTSALSQAVIRRLPLDECGCLGDLLTLPPRQMLMFDMVMWCGIGFLCIRAERVLKWSLDAKFHRSKTLKEVL